jgi:hypothetical protein
VRYGVVTDFSISYPEALVFQLTNNFLVLPSG